ncbi:MAG: hypothetical protein HYY06_04190 [Deltaproteobacteria bacterium]|nr:hypothetical protein [Deltaproteobacteria bacterium]
MSPEALPVDRTYRERDELDWLPWSMRSLRWTVPGSILTGLPAAVGAGAYLAVPELAVAVLAGFMSTYVSVIVGFVAGPKLARRMMVRRLSKLARGQLDLSALRRRSDGQLIHVRGRVEADRTIPGILTGEPAVFRRARFALDTDYFFHEAGTHFTLVDPAGERLPVQVHDARIVTPELLWTRIDRDSWVSLVERIPESLGPELEARAERAIATRGGFEFLGNEILVRDGDLVDVVGYKSQVADFTIAERMHREMPMRPVLRSGRALPLVISPVVETGRPFLP